MLRSALSKVMWVGRATVFTVGLAVILGAMFGVASIAVAHTADTKLFHLGHSNTASAISILVGSVSGPSLRIHNNSTNTAATALALQVERGKSPMKVNSATKVTNLNADKLDGKDSSAFAPAQAEGWHEVGASGEPAFTSNERCSWKNFDTTNEESDRQTAAFFRDPFGVVHLKGVVDADDGVATGGCVFTFAEREPLDDLIYTLPEGYRPEKPSVHVVLTNDQLGEVIVDSTGSVVIDFPTTNANAKEWVSLDGITFRAAN
jgi:hypothetical protein